MFPYPNLGGRCITPFGVPMANNSEQFSACQLYTHLKNYYSFQNAAQGKQQQITQEFLKADDVVTI